MVGSSSCRIGSRSLQKEAAQSLLAHSADKCTAGRHPVHVLVLGLLLPAGTVGSGMEFLALSDSRRDNIHGQAFLTGVLQNFARTESGLHLSRLGFADVAFHSAGRGQDRHRSLHLEFRGYLALLSPMKREKGSRWLPHPAAFFAYDS